MRTRPRGGVSTLEAADAGAAPTAGTGTIIAVFGFIKSPGYTRDIAFMLKDVVGGSVNVGDIVSFSPDFNESRGVRARDVRLITRKRSE